MLLKTLITLGLACSAQSTPLTRRDGNDTPVYKNPLASINDRIADLLPRMTLAEKVAQITQGDIRAFINISNTDQKFNATGLIQEMAIRGGQIWTGVPNNMDREKLVWAIELGQRYLLENTTLGIPALFQTEGLHGFIDNGTIFPSPLAMGCSFNPSLMHKSAKWMALEAGSLGITHLFAPVLDIALEQRFGRVEEGFGEDWYLTSRMGKGFVDGLQEGKRPNAPDTAVAFAAATCKHFAAFATPQNGLNLSPVDGGERQLRSVYLRAFHHACLDSMTFMSSYNSYDGTPVSASYHIMTEILRNEWGYDKFVTTDAGATDNLMTLHGVASTREECAQLTLENGQSGEMGGGTYVYSTLEAQVNEGLVNETLINNVVRHLLRTKFEMGLFEAPYPYSNWKDYDRTAEAAAVEKQMDLESIVLLENRNNTLPIKKGSRVALIGPQAGQSNLGDYVFPPAVIWATTALEGFGNLTESHNLTINYGEGCKRWSNDESGFDQAIAAAEDSDVAVVMVGTWSRDQNELWEGLNATTGEHVDLSDLALVGAQLALVKAIKQTGVPTVVVFVSGKPVAEPWIADNADAIVQQFYPGDAGGLALAEVLMGIFNPGGKLPISVPRDVGTLPVYYNYLKGARPTDPGQVYDNGTLVFGHQYVLNSPAPLWSFGHGLSYTNFTYNSLCLSKNNVTIEDTVDVTVEVTNSGKVDGHEVVQIYYKDVYSSVVTPVKQLVAFNKVYLAAGETQMVNLTIVVEDIGLWNERNKWVVEKGEFIVWAGGASNNLPLNTTLYAV